MKVMASAGAGYDWVDVNALAECGTFHPSHALGEWGEIGKGSYKRLGDQVCMREGTGGDIRMLIVLSCRNSLL